MSNLICIIFILLIIVIGLFRYAGILIKDHKEMIKRKKYYNLETDLLFHKYRYYELNDPVITDYEYDMLEKEARNISTIMDSISSVHSMVGFTKNHRLWNKVKEKYNIK